ncbi:MAG: hypothetical protein G01um101444_217, partial [Parcubacteria group bacterium Gr01-1014_44]
YRIVDPRFPQAEIGTWFGRSIILGEAHFGQNPQTTASEAETLVERASEGDSRHYALNLACFIQFAVFFGDLVPVVFFFDQRAGVFNNFFS